MLMKSCPKCGKLIPYGLTYCPPCKTEVDKGRGVYLSEKKKANDKIYNRNRDPKYTKFYNSKAWRTLSRTRIQMDNYRCVKCGAFAEEVDHIIPIQQSDGWEKRFDIDNLQTLCKACHNEKHKRFLPKSAGVPPKKGCRGGTS